jgi:transcriptional regulator with XRE-family HTH domain
VGGTLRRYREAFGATLADAAEVLGCGVSKVSRMEAGERGIRPDELRLLLTEYGIDDGDTHAALMIIADPGRVTGWDGTRALRVVISEAALHQSVGSPAVMRQQVTYLAALAESAQVDLQVVPFGAVIHPAPDLGALSILLFGEAPAGISVTYLPGASAGQLLTGSDASPYLHSWEELRACALAPEESGALLRQLAVT